MCPLMTTPLGAMTAADRPSALKDENWSSESSVPNDMADAPAPPPHRRAPSICESPPCWEKSLSLSTPKARDKCSELTLNDASYVLVLGLYANLDGAKEPAEHENGLALAQGREAHPTEW